MLASVGRAEVACARRPRVTVLTTGDELQEPGEPLRPGAIRNSNAYSLAALVERSGARAGRRRDRARRPRRAPATRSSAALGGDVTVVSGGVSVGEHDHVRPALAELGVEQVFWGVALRPGKPTYFGVDAAGGGLGRSACPATRSRRWSPSCSSSGPRSARLLGAADDPAATRATAILDERYAKRAGPRTR